MSEKAPHKSHATGWIIGVVLALVLYVGSEMPVCCCFYSNRVPRLPHSWMGPVSVFYMPADWLWDQTPNEFKDRWEDFWIRTLDIQRM